MKPPGAMSYDEIFFHLLGAADEGNPFLLIEPFRDVFWGISTKADKGSVALRKVNLPR